MAKVKTCNVKFEVVLEGPSTENVFLVGNLTNLGVWDEKKALLMKHEGNNVYSLTKRCPLDTDIEFKVLSSKDYKNVERGMFGEEIENHKLNSNEGKVSIVVYNFL